MAGDAVAVQPRCPSSLRLGAALPLMLRGRPALTVAATAGVGGAALCGGAAAHA